MYFPVALPPSVERGFKNDALGGGSPGVEDKIEMTQAWPRGSRKMKRWNKNAGTLQEAQTLKTNDTKATREGGEGMTSRGIIVNYYELIRITKLV